MDMTKLIVTFRNFANLLINTTSHTTILLPLSLAEGRSVLDKFFIPKFHSSKI